MIKKPFSFAQGKKIAGGVAHKVPADLRKILTSDPVARAAWEERFAISYDAPLAGTIDDRTAVGRIESADERYFEASYVEGADGVVITKSHPVTVKETKTEQSDDPLDLGAAT